MNNASHCNSHIELEPLPGAHYNAHPLFKTCKPSMSRFKENLKTFTQPYSQLASLEGYGDTHEATFVIENRPGSEGALAVYYEVAVRHGGLTPKAAEEALALFAEHTDDARAHPGTHPNIDRLFAIIQHNLYYSIKAVPKNDV